MGKRIYRSTSVNVLDLEKLVEAVKGRRITFAIDVAKRDFKAVVMARPEAVLATLSWQAPKDTRRLVEVTEVLELGSATMLALLETYGTPEQIAKAPSEARALMVRVGGPLLMPDKIDRVLELAKSSTGTTASPGESALLRVLAAETNRQRRQAAAARREVEEQGQKHDGVRRVSEVLGKASASVLFVEAGDPSLYKSADAYTKALGLNLKIKNSGKPADHGRLKITKRGAPRARFTLYMAVLRLIQHEPRFKAWYARKVERDGGQMKLKAVVALMRKLAKATWHVSRGTPFDSAKLFDDARLGLAA